MVVQYVREAQIDVDNGRQRAREENRRWNLQHECHEVKNAHRKRQCLREMKPFHAGATRNA